MTWYPDRETKHNWPYCRLNICAKVFVNNLIGHLEADIPAAQPFNSAKQVKSFVWWAAVLGSFYSKPVEIFAAWLNLAFLYLMGVEVIWTQLHNGR